MNKDNNIANVTLKRAITMPQIVLYGLGTMVGAGIYALTGKVAGLAGMSAPIAFLIAGLIALINAFTYAELSARIPLSAGEAQYVHEAFKQKWLSQLVGWLVITTGVVSAATLTVASIGFLRDLVHIPEHLGMLVFVVGLGLIAIWGITESIRAIIVITFIELGALVYIVGVAGERLLSPTQWASVLPASATLWPGILSGAFLAFYAFVGFEDMVNVAEEVKNVRHNLPRAILLCVGLTTLIYVLVSFAAVVSVKPDTLAKAATPFLAVVGHSNYFASLFIVLVSLLTGINGALVQVIMASRVAYGLAKNAMAPQWFADVNATTRTPIKATLMIMLIVLLLAFFFPLITLAKATSTVILIIFALLNLALLHIKRRGDTPPDGVRCYPIGLPALGLTACIALLGFQFYSYLLIL